MSLSFIEHRRFHAGYSLLGRQIHRRIKDVHYAEGIFILALCGTGVGLVLAFFIGWALIQPLAGSYAGDPEVIARLYAVSQVIAGVLFFLTCFYGYKPALRAAVGPDGIDIEQGDAFVHIPLESVRDFSSISALQFHRHYRKFKKTRSFFVRLPSILLLITTDAGPVVLGLSPEDQKSLTDRLLLERIRFDEEVAVPIS